MKCPAAIMFYFTLSSVTGRVREVCFFSSPVRMGMKRPCVSPQGLWIVERFSVDNFLSGFFQQGLLKSS